MNVKPQPDDPGKEQEYASAFTVEGKDAALQRGRALSHLTNGLRNRMEEVFTALPPEAGVRFEVRLKVIPLG